MDKITGENIIEMENKFSQVNLKSIHSLICSSLLKLQGSLNEQIIAYQNEAYKLKKSNNIKIELNNNFFKSIFDLTPTFLNENLNNMDYIAYWVLDKNITEDKITPNSIEQKQIYSFINVVPHLYTTFSSTQGTSFSYYFIFDLTDLFITFPLRNYYESGSLDVLMNYKNKVWCTKPNGEIYTVYKAKCRDYYVNIQKAKTSIFDNNINDFQNRSIFITEFYQDLGESKAANIYTMCIQFEDPISNQSSYTCADIIQDNLVNAFEKISSKIPGYFLVTPVGFNRVFYFPHKIVKAFTPCEAIFSKDKNFFLEEKNYFLNRVQNMMTSNYLKNIGNNTLWEEVFVNGKNNSEQYFYFQSEKYYFSIFPVILENLKGKKEHVLSIIYVYNNRDLVERVTTKKGNIYAIILCILIIFLVFGLGLLYLVVLSFETLSKYIVISIKNVNYMLKGINIGGNNRLEYLDSLRKRQDENLELLENMVFFNENDINKSNNENLSDINLNTDENNYKDQIKIDENNKGLELIHEDNILNDKANVIEVSNENFNI